MNNHLAVAIPVALVISAATACAGTSAEAGSGARNGTPTQSASDRAQTTEPSSAPAGRACANGGGAFSLSLPPGLVGKTTPVAAAQQFATAGGVPGYGDSSSQWRTVATDSTGTTVVSGSARLHVLKLANGTWAVDQGAKCVG
jgi:hypothetical protein